MENHVREHLNKPDILKSTEPDRLHPQVLRDLVDVTVRPLLIIFARSWCLRDVSEGWTKANVTPMFKKGKKEDLWIYRLVSLTSVPGKVMEQIILKTISRHLKDKKMVRIGQQGFTNGELRLTNLIVFSSEGTSLVDEGRVVNVV